MSIKNKLGRHWCRFSIENAGTKSCQPQAKVLSLFLSLFLALLAQRVGAKRAHAKKRAKVVGGARRPHTDRRAACNAQCV